MIRTANTNTVSPHVAARSQTMRVERLSPTEFRVTNELGKVRIVKFHIDIAIECYTDTDKAGCPANDHAIHCGHCEAAIQEFLKVNEE